MISKKSKKKLPIILQKNDKKVTVEEPTLTVDEKSETTDEAVALTNSDEEITVLVLCAGGGTSAMLANSLNKRAQNYSQSITALSGTYGNHREQMDSVDIIVLAP